MILPTVTKKATTEIYRQILSALQNEYPRLGFYKHLLLPDGSTRINGDYIGPIITGLMVEPTVYGRLVSTHILLYKVGFTFNYCGVNSVICIDYRHPTEYFTPEFLKGFSDNCVHDFTELYWETGGGPGSGTPHYYTLCRQCLSEKKVYRSAITSIINIVKDSFYKVHKI